MPPEGDRLCPKCGQLIPAGQTECPVCTAPQGFLWSLERETLVLVSLLLLGIFFAVTAFVNRRYDVTQNALGGHWYQKGVAALKANDPNGAVEAFHTALVYARDNDVYQMELADALVRAGRTAEADVYLRTLWEHAPGDGMVNLELARLAARQSDVSRAVRYYHNAIFGVWDSNPIARRQQARLELCRFLLSEGQTTQATSELIALQADLPPDADVHTQVAEMFLEVKDYRRALEVFRQAAKLNPKQVSAWEGAGTAAVHLGDFADARSYLVKAAALDPQNLDIAQQLEVSKLALALDPFARRLSEQERRRRTIAAFSQALARVQQCAQSGNVNLQAQPPTSPLQIVYAEAKKMQPKVNSTGLQSDPDLISNVMDLVYHLENRAQDTCGVVPAPDEALMLISRSRGATER